METFFYNLHKAGAALGAIITLVLLIKLMRGIAQKQSYDTLAQRMMLAFSGLITAEWLIGIAILIARGDFMNVPLCSTLSKSGGIRKRVSQAFEQRLGNYHNVAFGA